MDIYTLSDPRDGYVRYVGKSEDIKTRLSGHCSDKLNVDKYSWITELKKNDLTPVLEVIDSSNIGHEASLLERMYIGLFKSWGFELFNKFGYSYFGRPKRNKTKFPYEISDMHKRVKTKIIDRICSQIRIANELGFTPVTINKILTDKKVSIKTLELIDMKL